MQIKKQFLFGYSRDQVHEKIQALEVQVKSLTARLEQKEVLLAQTQEELNTIKGLEQEIAQSVIDAKRLAAEISTNAHEDARTMLAEAEAMIEERFNKAQADLEDLNRIKDNILTQEISMKRSVQELMEQYILQLKSEQVQEISREIGFAREAIEHDVERGQEIVKKEKDSKLIVVFPDNFSGIQSAHPTHLELEVEEAPKQMQA